MKLDKTDLTIIRILQKDSEITKAGLAKHIDLSVSAAWERVKQLEKKGVIKGYQAIIDVRKAVNCEVFLLHISLKQHTKEDWKKFNTAIQDIPEIVECHHTSGTVDYALQVVTNNVTSYNDLVDSLLDKDIGIIHYTSYTVINVIKDSNGGDISYLLKSALKK